jgi:tetratricopeptide (TPR) repeat protein/predicted Ser/Thr protein kinase
MGRIGQLGGDPIDVALVRASVRRKLFGLEEPPITVSRFVVVRRLGTGGTGNVYEARDPELNRTVALKLLRRAADPERLLAEARALARLRHPNVVVVYDVGTWRGHVFLAMEHVNGVTLRAWLDRGPRPRPWRQIARALAPAARALAAAHAAGLAHRDVKPENILIAEDGQGHVVDFGLARAEDMDGAGEGEGVARGTQPSGTPGYQAPECGAGAPGDARGDQFAFAVTLYEALWGDRPSAGARPPADRGIPAALRRAIARALAAEPDARHGSMDALVAALEHDPARTVRRVAIAAILVGAGVGLTIAVTPRRATAGDPCGGGDARLAEVWNPERRAALDAAFTRSKLVYGPPSFAAAAAKLDRFAAAWIAGHRDSCQATHVRREQSEAVLDLRTRCLEQRRAALASTIAVLAGGEQDVVERAAAIVDALPPVDACADVATLSAPRAPPSDPAARRKLAEVEARVPEPTTLAAAGRLPRAREAAEQLVVDARALGHRPLLADALLALGSVQARERDRTAAKTSTYDALLEAQSSGHDAIVARAAMALVELEVETPPRAHEWARLADATLTRIGRPPRLVAEYEESLALLARAEGKSEEVVRRIEAAIAASEQAGQADQVIHAAYLSNFGTSLTEVGRRPEARVRLQAALALYERLVGAIHPDVARTLSNLADVEEDLGMPEAALAHFERASAIFRDLGQEETVLAARILSVQTSALESLGRMDEALARSRRAIEILERRLGPDDDVLGGVINRRGNLLQAARRHEEALAAYERARAIWSKTRGGEHPFVATALGNVGETRRRMGQARAALAPCERAVAIGTRARAPKLATYLRCLGAVQLDLNRSREAIATFERGLALGPEGGATPDVVAELQLGLARALWTTRSERPRAITLARQARDTFAGLAREPERRAAEDWLATHR